MKISPFPAFPFPFGQAVFYSPSFSRTQALSLSSTFWGVFIPPGCIVVLHSEVHVELSFLLHCAKWLSFNHLASWLCFVYGGVFFLFSNLHFVWWGGNIFVQMVLIPGHFAEYLWARNHWEFFFFWLEEVPHFLHIASSCKSQVMFPLQNNCLKTHTFTCTHI